MNLKQVLVLVCAFSNILPAAVRINEIHYDNAGSDINEFIEIVITDPLTMSPTDIGIYFYNGGDGKEYKAFNLGSDFISHGILSDNYAYFSKLVPGIQNGPDGLAITYNGVVSEFISYEGLSFTASNGPATGMTSTNILVYEATSTPLESSLQRMCFSDTWILTEGYNTMGQVNTGCTIPGSVPIPGSCLLTLLGLGLARASRKRVIPLK